jgi:hypothetical protein
MLTPSLYIDRELTIMQAFVAIHIAAIVATTWILMLNGLVGYQLLDDGTPVSIGLLFLSAVILFVGTGYIALDTGFSWTNYWNDTLSGENKAYALYTLYQLVPLVFLVIFFCLESFLVLRVLGERKPMRTYQVFHLSATTNNGSVSCWRSSAFCHWTDLPVCHQCSHLHRVLWQDQRWSL